MDVEKPEIIPSLGLGLVKKLFVPVIESISIFWLSDFGSTNEGLNVKPPKAKDEFPLINTLNESFSSLFVNSYVISNCATPSSITSSSSSIKGMPADDVVTTSSNPYPSTYEIIALIALPSSVDSTR